MGQRRRRIVIVELEPFEYAWACHVGNQRFIANWYNTDGNHYQHRTDNNTDDRRTADMAAAICELAIAKATNRYWAGHVWAREDHQKYRGRPDVGTNIEVRRSKNNQSVMVFKKDLNKNQILFAAHPIPPEFRLVHVWGFLNCDEAWKLGEPSKFDPDNSRHVSKNLFQPIAERTPTK